MIINTCIVLAVVSLTAPQLPDAKVVLGNGKEISVPYVRAKPLALKGDPSAAKYSERSNRSGFECAPISQNGLEIVRRVINGVGGYVRSEFEVKNVSNSPIMINRFEFLKDWSPDGKANGKISGNTDGSVAVFPDYFVGVEHPMAQVQVNGGKVTATLPREFEIQPNETWIVSYVVGKYIPGQLRRNFQTYLNRERAHPYRVLPHYNSWYDINIGRNDAPWQKRMNEAEALGVMQHFRKELSEKRGVFIDSYLWDDGWDNWDSLWDFHPGFPNGFRKLADEAHKNKGASIGAWLSPCGGYGGSNAARVRYAKSKGIIGQNDGLLRMSSPAYYKAFRDQVVMMINEYDMNLFKFDRMGVGHDCDGAPASYAPDMEAIVRLIGEMRAAKQDVFVNCTVGTWASPFWVMFADSIWRGDQDFGRKGPGRARQQWVTYRDNQIYDRFVAKAPLFPLNSLMNHGIIVTRHGPPSCEDVSKSETSTQDFADEVWMSMACGTDLQEYYISPDLMDEKWWDILAEAIKWLKANAGTLRDVHWVGGDPVSDSGNAIYGYASLSKKSAIVALRNPSEKAQSIRLTHSEIFELPEKWTIKGKSAKTIYSHDAKFVANNDELAVEFQPFGMVLLQFQVKTSSKK